MKMSGNGCTIMRMRRCHGTIRQYLGDTDTWSGRCLRQVNSPWVLTALSATVCILKFPWVYACSCTVNTYASVCFKHPTLIHCLSVCRHAAADSTVIKLSLRRGNSALFKRLPFPPYTKNNNYSTILVNHKPPAWRDQKGEAFQRAARTGPPQGRITDRTVPLCLSGVIGHMLEWSWLAILYCTIGRRRGEEKKGKEERRREEESGWEERSGEEMKGKESRAQKMRGEERRREEARGTEMRGAKRAEEKKGKEQK